MPRPWNLDTLKEWDDRIRQVVDSFGLNCFPQEFEICDQNQMLGYMAYSGMPAHYPHWSYGKSYEKLKTLYEYGVSGLPYEMVINSNPSLAYLMRDNSLCLQILTIAHVYGHNDFFANNFTFQDTRPELTISNMKVRADRLRDYIEDPSIGLRKIETILDAAHALSLNCRRHRAIRKLTELQQRERALADLEPPHDPYAHLHPPRPREEPDLNRVPLEPEEDLLLFIRDHNPYLSDWEQDVLTIVHEQAQYFLPQIETKIMNEGWASYWHHRILNALELPQDLHLEFIVLHNQVIRPHPGGLNPYHLGFRIFEEIVRRQDEGAPRDDDRETDATRKTGDELIFDVREVDRDASFIRRFLDEDMMRELDMFEHEAEGEDRVISRVSDPDNWEQIKQTLLRNIGMASTPVIRITDADYAHNRELMLSHGHDGRDLDLEYAEKTMAYMHQLWGRTVHMETVVDEKPVVLTYTEDGLKAQAGGDGESED
ncbi:MAG: stage V sporulation protein R [Phycisphaeraceae bacterium]|nr:stage V sporulation protein R [Phycisphaeraceae bacterium]